MAEVVHLKEAKKEDGLPSAVPKTTWSGSLRMGLVNIPVKVLPITKDNVLAFDCFFGHTKLLYSISVL